MEKKRSSSPLMSSAVLNTWPLAREGSDIEDDESARTRTLRSWSELAQRAIQDTFVNTAESVPGVLFAQADCEHPRGQGTVDERIDWPSGILFLTARKGGRTCTRQKN